VAGGGFEPSKAKPTVLQTVTAQGIMPPEREHAWPDWEDHGLVFPPRRGTPMEPDNLRRSLTQIRRAAGLDAVRFHDLRHTCVTLLLDLGVPPHVVREIAGHSDIDVTMTIYAHVSLEEKRKALRKLGEALR
jgi:integrase